MSNRYDSDVDMFFIAELEMPVLQSCIKLIREFDGGVEVNNEERSPCRFPVMTPARRS